MSETAKPAAKGRKPARARGEQLVAERLLKDEYVVKQAVISDGIYWRAAGVFILALLVAVFLVAELGALLAVVAVLMAAYAIILKEILFLAVTNKRILARYGILQVDIVDIHFDKVESIELKRMLPGYILDYADVVIMGTGNRYIVVPFVANAIELRRAYNELTLNQENTPAAQPAPMNIQIQE